MHVTAAVLLACSALLVLAATRSLVSPAGLLVVSILPTMLGVGQIADRGGVGGVAWLVLLFPLVFALGASGLSLRRKAHSITSAGGAGLRSTEIQRGWGFALLAILPLCALHFSALGIAALSSSVEIQRFSLNSGYGGVPSRAVLFVLPILALGSAVAYPRASRLSLVSIWATFIFTRLAMGFKSSLLEIFVLVIVALMLRGSLLRLRSSVALGVVFVGALGYANWIATKYRTIGSAGLSLDYLVDRLGRQSAEPATTALQLLGWNPPNFFINDIQYFSARYFGFGAFDGFATDQVVSAIVTGTPLSRTEFIVPVTLGGPAYLIGSLGRGGSAVSVIAVLGSVFLLGRLWRSACRRIAAASSTTTTVAAWAGALLAMRAFVVNGAGAYVLINYAVAVLLCVLLLRLGEWIGSQLDGRERTNVLVAPPNRDAASTIVGPQASLDTG